uniref:Uncharacterized protein n=1 Tax=Arundo donax TaxID=35708 RepID=A0A0A8Z0Y2_ARUDO
MMQVYCFTVWGILKPVKILCPNVTSKLDA